MSAIRVRKRIDSETITLPELGGFIGREVDVSISDDAPETALETRSTFLGSAPAEPTPEEHDRNMAELRERAKSNPKAAAWLAAIEADAIDVERVIGNRGRA